MINLSPHAPGVARGRPGSPGDKAPKLLDLGAAGAGSDNTLYALLLVVGALIVVPTLIRGGYWGAEATLGAVLCVLAGRALLINVVFYARDRYRQRLVVRRQSVR